MSLDPFTMKVISSFGVIAETQSHVYEADYDPRLRIGVWRFTASSFGRLGQGGDGAMVAFVGGQFLVL